MHFIGDELPAGSYGLCEGDCDTSDDCIGDLVCFSRDGGDPNEPPVPGCLDPYNNMTVHESIDFCCDPNVDGCVAIEDDDQPGGEFDLRTIGNNGDDVFPLPICRGDCDDDQDCEGEFRCFQREGLETVPGCIGAPDVPDDYCGDPTGYMFWVSADDGVNAIVPFYPKDVPLLANGLLVCMGDCDSDADCAGALVCYNRDSGDTNPAPGCLIYGQDTEDFDNVDFCCDPLDPVTGNACSAGASG